MAECLKFEQLYKVFSEKYSPALAMLKAGKNKVDRFDGLDINPLDCSCIGLRSIRGNPKNRNLILTD